MTNNELLRLLDAFSNEDKPFIKRFLVSRISREKSKKNWWIANELEKFISNFSGLSKIVDIKNNDLDSHWHKILELPKNPRNNESLVTLIPHNVLKHEMILSPETEERIVEIENEFIARMRLAKYNLQPKRKILLYGAPWCWKTLWAERIAWTVWLPLIKVNFDSLISSYLWQTASNLRTVFQICNEMPCVLLLDECDIIAKSRIAKNDVWEMSRIVNILLTLLDEYNADGMIIATTNLEDHLDKALYRRFDDIVEFQKPSRQEVEELLRFYTSGLKLDKDIVWDKLLTKLEGNSHAIISAISNNASKKSILDNRKTISNLDFEMAIRELYRIK